MKRKMKNRTWSLGRRLACGVLALALLLGLMPLTALEARAAEDLVVQIPVSIRRETAGGIKDGAEPKDGAGKVKIEGCDYVEPRGVPDDENYAASWEKKNGSALMPKEAPVLTVPASGATFTWSIPDTDVKPGEMYSYKITQVPGSTSNLIYDDNEYILEIYIQQVDPSDVKKFYATTVIRDDDAEDPDAKPDGCEFVNKKKYSVTYIDGEDPDTVYQEDSDISSGDDEPDPPEDPTKDGKKFKGWKRTVVTDDDGDIVEILYEAEWEDLIPPTATNAETWGKQGETQESGKTNPGSREAVGKIKFNKGDADFVSIQLIDPHTGKPTDAKTVDALDKDGKVVGTYTLTYDLETGEATVVFKPNPDFVGDPQPAQILATDENGFTVMAEYQPHVLAAEVTPSTTPSKTPTKAPTVTPKKASSASKATSVKTGDEFRALPYIIGLVAAAIVLGGILVARRRRKKEDEE